MKRFIFASLLALPMIALPSIALAQLGGQTSGTFGSRNLGGTISNPTTGFSGQNQSYSAGVGASSGATTGGLEGAGQVSSNDRFVRGARQAGQFVGGDSGEARAVGQQNAGANAQTGNGMNGLNSGRNGQLGGGLNGRNGQLGGVGGLGGGLNSGLNRNARGGTGQLGGLFGANSDFGGGGASQKPLRTPLVLGFEMPAAARNTRLTTHFQTRLARVPQLQASGPLNIQVEGQTAVLRGQVASEHDRALAARLALLEPGIANVKNELTVVPKATVPAAESIPTPTPAATVVPPAAVNPAR